jgi:hypothetical protein
MENVEKLKKDKSFLLQVCKFALVVARQGRDVTGILKEAINQIEISEGAK